MIGILVLGMYSWSIMNINITIMGLRFLTLGSIVMIGTSLHIYFKYFHPAPSEGGQGQEAGVSSSGWKDGGKEEVASWVVDQELEAECECGEGGLIDDV